MPLTTAFFLFISAEETPDRIESLLLVGQMGKGYSHSVVNANHDNKPLC